MSDIAEITQLVLHERQGRDRGWWEQMAGCFHPDSSVSLSWFNGSGPDFVERSRVMSESGLRPLHRLSPPVLQVRGSRAFVEVPAAVEARFPIDGVEADLVSYSRLLYRVERRAAVWKILSLAAVYERDTLTSAIPGCVLNVDAERLASFRKSYRCLAYHISLRGLEPAQDLCGDDEPGPVSALYHDAFEWLHAAAPASGGAADSPLESV